MRRATRKWRNALPVIGFLCLALTLATAVYTYRYEPDRYAAEYAFFALPAGTQTDENAQVAARMLARDCDALLHTPSFREEVLKTVESDGKTRLSATSNGAHIIRVRALGENPDVVVSMANGAGRALMASAGEVLRATDAREVEPAVRPGAPWGPPKPVRVAGMLVASFLCLSVLGLLFGSSREPVCYRRGRVQPCGLPFLGAVANCDQAVRAQTGRAGRAAATVALCDRVSPLVRENVRGTSLALLANKGRGGRVVVLTGMEADESNAAVSLLLCSELATQGFDVLLMEMDASASYLRGLLHAQGRRDLWDCLQSESALREAILPTPVARLCFMDLYHDERFVSSVAATEAFASFLSDAAHSFDYVVLNAPAAPRHSEAAMLAAVADATLLIVPEGRYTAEEIEDAAMELSRGGKSPGGFILSRTPKRRFDRSEVRARTAQG